MEVTIILVGNSDCTLFGVGTAEVCLMVNELGDCINNFTIDCSNCCIPKLRLPSLNVRGRGAMFTILDGGCTEVCVKYKTKVAMVSIS